MIKQALASGLVILLIAVNAEASTGTGAGADSGADTSHLNYGVELAHNNHKKNNYQTMTYGYKGTYPDNNSLTEMLNVNSVVLGLSYDF